MSALPPKADMCSALADVCFGPIADIRQCSLPAKIGRREAMILGHPTVGVRPNEKGNRSGLSLGFTFGDPNEDDRQEPAGRSKKTVRSSGEFTRIARIPPAK